MIHNTDNISHDAAERNWEVTQAARVLHYMDAYNIDLAQLAREQHKDVIGDDHSIHITGLLDLIDPLTGTRYRDMTDSLLATPYLTGELSGKKLLPMVHGKATDTLALMARQQLSIDPYSGIGTANRNSVHLTLRSINGGSSLSVSAHKLLSVAIYCFSRNNCTAEKTRAVKDLRVSIPLREYAAMCGYDVEEHAAETGGKDKKRTENALKNARKKIRRDLDTLYNASLTWDERVRGQNNDYYNVRIISAQGIRNGYIMMTLSQEMADYLIQLPMTQYPVALLGLDERNRNAYALGLKLSEHYNIDNNHKRGTAQLLRVSTLLRVTSLPDIETLRLQRSGWDTRIKEPLESALDALTACGLLSDWYYSKPKGGQMTDAEATSLLTYESWSDTLIHYTLTDTDDNRQRLQGQTAAKAEKRSEKPSKKKATYPKKG